MPGACSMPMPWKWCLWTAWRGSVPILWVIFPIFIKIMICPVPVRVCLSAQLDYVLSEGGPRWETFHRWRNNLDEFFKEIWEWYLLFSTFTMFLKGNSVITVQIGNSMVFPRNSLALKRDVWWNTEKESKRRTNKTSSVEPKSEALKFAGKFNFTFTGSLFSYMN